MECDQGSGQCICKPGVDSRRCDECKSEFYQIQENDLFGCNREYFLYLLLVLNFFFFQLVIAILAVLKVIYVTNFLDNVFAILVLLVAIVENLSKLISSQHYFRNFNLKLRTATRLPMNQFATISLRICSLIIHGKVLPYFLIFR